jgi:hypothetical protein
MKPREAMREAALRVGAAKSFLVLFFKKELLS